MVNDSDEALVTSFIEQADGAAMETLFRRHLPRVYALASRYLPIREDAEEAVSETLLRAFRALKARQFRGEASLKTWLARVAVNVCLERLRQPRLPILSLSDIEDVPAAPPGRSSVIGDAIAVLPDAYRLVVTLCDLEGYTADEAAAVLGRSVTATKSLHYRARRMLRDALDDIERGSEQRRT
jgi:RNA polymerase sigma-70 factor (ECF subfamily)